MLTKPAKRAGAFFLAMVLCFSFMSSLIPAQAVNNYELTFGIKDTTDDSEEWVTGSKAGQIDYNSSDLEIGWEKPDKTGDERNEQIVAVRFADLTIPKGATITSAYVQFTADRDADADGATSKSTNPFDIQIYAENTANSAPIVNEENNISSRVITADSVSWYLNDEVSLWKTMSERGEYQRTPDVKSLIQQIIDKEDWTSGNALCFQLRGTGNRTAATSEDAADMSTGPVLHVTFSYEGAIDHAAPTGLTGIGPTSANGSDGKITGTTAEMEYRLSSDSDWLACTGAETVGLAAGDYLVRYAASAEYNASAPVTVTVPAFIDYTAKDITLQLGADESKLNFTWYSGSAAAAQVQIAPKSAMTGDDFPAASAHTFSGTAVASGSFTSNEAAATGLATSTEYVYRVGDGTNFSGVYSFKTQDSSNGYNALLVGDPQIGSSGDEVGDTAGWQNTLTTALTRFPETSFILSAGDQVEKNSSESQYDGFFSPEELRSMPLVPAIGNHDNGALYAYHFNSPNESTEFGKTDAGGDYSFVYGNTLYMVLNSNNASITSHETFIEQAIEEAGDNIVWKVVMFHHSIYSSASHSDDNDIVAGRNAFYPVFDKYDIDVVLMGHDHCYTRTRIMKGGQSVTDGTENSVKNPDGILYITANSGSGSKYYDFKEVDTAWRAVRWQGKEPSYSNIEVTDSSFKITTFKSGDNSVIDTYTILKEAADPSSVDFAVLTTTDMHGKVWDQNVLTGGTVGNSMLKVATAVEDIRNTYGEDNVVLIDNGDVYQGTPVSSYQISQLTQYLSNGGSTEGLNGNLIADGNFLTITPMALALKYIGYDVSVLGNHEFNYDWSAMNSIYDYLEDGTNGYASVPVLAANLYWDGTTGGHAAGENAFTPYITKDITVSGKTFKIGILGLENPDCPRWDVPENYPGITFATDSTAEVNKYVPLMKDDGCDFIILAYHSGLGTADDNALTFGVNTENQIARVIAHTTGIDMVIAGHDHSTGYSNNRYKNADDSDVLVVNGGGTELTKSVFTATRNSDDSISVTVKSSANLNLTSYVNDEALKAMIAPYAAAASDYVGQTVGTLTGSWDSVTNYYLAHSDTIDLINRAEIAEGSKHIAEKYDTPDKLAALYNATGLDHITVDMASTSVVVDGNYKATAGPLTMKDIYKMYKYDNTLYLLPLTGRQIKDILEYNAENRLSVSISGGAAHYGTIGDDFTNPVFYGLDFTYDMAKAPGERVVITGFANGNPFDLAKTYVLAVNNYHLGNGPFAAYSTDDAIWSQTDDLGGGTVQDLIADFVADETADKGGVSPAPSRWSLSYSGSLADDLADTDYIAYAAETAPADGDTVIIYYNAGGTAVSPTVSGTKLATADVTKNGGVLYAKNTAAAFQVAYDSNKSAYTFQSGGKYLTSGATGNSLSLTDTANDCSYWALESTEGGWLVRNVGAAYNGNHNQYLEFYSGFTTYGLNTGNLKIYTYSFYKVIPAATRMESAPADGDQVVIWYNAGGQVIGSTQNASMRLSGVKSAVVGELLPVYEGSAAFDVDYDGATGYYTFTSGGKYLTSGDTGNSLGLTDTANDCSYWTLETTEGGWLVRNVGAAYNGNHNQYLEYYTNGFTTYGLQSNLSIYTYNFYQFNGYAPAAPTGNAEQAAPTGLSGVAPTTASNNNGSITGTTAEMEYRRTADTLWKACTGVSITGLLPGEYEVRYAEKTGYNASPSTKVTVPYYGSSTYIVKDLTIQPGADKSKMNFTWYSGSAASAQVQIAPRSAMTGGDFPAASAQTFGGTTVASGSFTSNEAGVTGLAASTEYVYRVGNGTEFSGVYSFSTRNAASYNTIFVGDPQIGCSGSVSSDLAGWQNTLTQALTKFPNTSFILGAGDQVEDASSEDQYDAFFTPAELTSTPYIPTIGNHDNGALYAYHFNSPNESAEYGQTSAGGDYWFTYGNTLYMVLNSNNQSALSHDTFMGQAIAAAGSDVVWKVVMFHHSIYSSATHSDDTDIVSRRSDLYPVFDKYDIDVVLMGHDHCYTRSYIMKGGIAQTDGTESSVTDPDGILYITANSASGSKYYDFKAVDATYKAFRWQEKEPSYSNIEVTDSSFKITTFKASDNSVIDTYTINKKTGGGTGGTGTGGTTKPAAPIIGTSTQGNSTTVSSSLTASVSADKAIGSLGTSAANALISAAKAAEEAGQNAVMEIALKADKMVASAEITIPRAAFTGMVSGTSADLKVNTPAAIVILDNKALNKIGETSSTGDIKISVDKADTAGLSSEDQTRIGDRPVYSLTVSSGSKTVSEFGDGRATVGIPYTPAAGEDKNAIVVYYISGSGEVQTLRGRYDPDAGMVEFTTRHFSKYAVGYNKVSFGDVTGTGWYYDAVTFLAARGITTGTTADTFSPDGTLSRGQFIVMLMRAYGIAADENSSDNFSDAGSSYYTSYLAAAKRLGIASGVGDNKFAPDSQITRQDMFTLLFRALDVLGELPETTGGKTTSDFSDAGQISSYAKEAMETLVNAGIVSGSGGKLDPSGTSTRAQMAQVLYNLLSA